MDKAAWPELGRIGITNHCAERYAQRVLASSTNSSPQTARQRLRGLLVTHGRVVEEPPRWFARKATGAQLYVVVDVAHGQLVLPLIHNERRDSWDAVTLVSRGVALADHATEEAWMVFGTTRLSPELLHAAQLAGETPQQTAARLRRLLAKHGQLQTLPPAWSARTLAPAELYLCVPEILALALRCENDAIITTDWWLEGRERTALDTDPSAGRHLSRVLENIDIEYSTLVRYRERVGGPLQSLEAITQAVRCGAILDQPPAWLLLRSNLVFTVLADGGCEADDAWVALAVRRRDSGYDRVAITSCVSRRWYAQTGLEGKRAALLLPGPPPNIIRWINPPARRVNAQWRTFRRTVRRRGRVLSERPAHTPADLQPGAAYLLLDNRVIASLHWIGNRLTLTDIIGWPLPLTADATPALPVDLAVSR